MSGHKWLVTAVSIGFVALLYSLPKVVVDNDSNETTLSDESEAAIALHSFNISSQDSLDVARWTNLLENEDDVKKSTIFADSLANLYLRLNLLDSAERYADLILTKSQGNEANTLAGDIYFKAFGFAASTENAKKFAGKAGQCFEALLKDSPKDPEIRSKLAMTLVTTSNPMQGINMLRDVLNEYPENITAMYSLGVLSMQSGQYDKAVERFEKLITLDPTNVQASFYLAVSYFETEQFENAKDWFEKVKTMDNDPAIHQAADNYLKEINEL